MSLPAFESPCALQDVETHAAIRVRDLGSGDPGTKTTYLLSEVDAALNDPTGGTYARGRKRPAILRGGTISRRMSDLFDGTLQPVTQSLMVADADRFFREIRALHGGNLIDSEFWFYLTSAGRRIADLAPRGLNHGYIGSDNLIESLGYQVQVNDIFGQARNRHATDLKIPQRTIRGANSASTPIFVNWNDPNLRNPRAVPWSFGSSDEGIILPPGYVPGGVVPGICVNEMTMADASVWVIGIVQGHDAKDGIVALYQPADETDPGLIPDADPEAKWPGQATAGWATINPSGADLFTDWDGERFLVFALQGARAAAFKDGSRPVYANVKGPTDTADGLGTEMTDGPILKRWALYNWLMRTPGYMTGAYYTTPPDFDFFPGSGVSVPMVDHDSFDRSLAIWNALTFGELKWGGVVGLHGDQQAAADVVAAMNRSSNPMAWTSSGQLRDCAFDFTRATFLRTPTILDAIAKRGITAAPSRFRDSLLPGMFTANLRVAYAFNGRTGQLHGDVQRGGNAEQFLQHGASPREYAAPFILTEDSANNVCQALLDLLSFQEPAVSQWSRTLCGLEDEIGDGRAITHPGGNGGNGYEDASHWILAQDVDTDNGNMLNSGLYVEPALT